MTSDSANFYEFSKIDDNNWLVWSRNTDHLPIVDVEASIGTPCFDKASIRANTTRFAQFAKTETGYITEDFFIPKDSDRKRTSPSYEVAWGGLRSNYIRS